MLSPGSVSGSSKKPASCTIRTIESAWAASSVVVSTSPSSSSSPANPPLRLTRTCMNNSLLGMRTGLLDSAGPVRRRKAVELLALATGRGCPVGPAIGERRGQRGELVGQGILFSAFLVDLHRPAAAATILDRARLVDDVGLQRAVCV